MTKTDSNQEPGLIPGSASPTKRFIAGAVCPRCGELDRIVAHISKSQQQIRECISCGFHERLTDLNNQPELETRITKKKTNQTHAPTQTQPIKFYKHMPERGKPD